jgi:hypothetical protein
MASNTSSDFSLHLLQNDQGSNDTTDNSSDEDTAEFEDEFGVDDNVLRPRELSLGLITDYVPEWEPLHAFREFYQNGYYTALASRLEDYANYL